jgi:hypothetical protein
MITSEAQVKQMEISAIITRADGTIENLGTIQYWHKNPLKRFLWRIKKWLHY